MSRQHTCTALWKANSAVFSPHSSEWISSSNSLLCCFLFFTPVLNKFHLIYFHSRGVFSPSSSNITCHFPRVPFLFFFLHLENAFQLFFSFTTLHQSVSHRPLKSFILIYIPVGFSLTHAYSCSCIIILLCIMIVDSSYFPISQFESWTFCSLAYHLFKHEGLNNAFIKKRKRLLPLVSGGGQSWEDVTRTGPSILLLLVVFLQFSASTGKAVIAKLNR